MDLGPVLRAHSYLRVERPFTLWPADVYYEVARDSSHNYTNGLDGGLVSYWLLRVLDDSLR